MSEQEARKIDPQRITVIHDEELAVVVAVTLGQRYPNIQVTGEENGCGSYDILGKSKYQGSVLSERVLGSMLNDAYVAQIAYRVTKSIKPGVNETSEELAARLDKPTPVKRG
jgi:hypothetical protein